MFNLGDVLLRLVLGDTSQFRSQVQREAEAAGASGGKTMGQRIADNLKTGFGALAGGLLVGATEQAAKFEDQLRTINTVAKLSDQELGNVGEGIKRLASETGKDLTDLTSGFYDLVSAGVPADKALDTLRNSAILAVGALGSTGEAVDIVTSALGAFNLDASQSARVTNIFAQTVADGKATVSDLAQGFQRVAPIAASMGISLEQVAAGTAVMTLNGASASQAYTTMAGSMNALLTPNADLIALQEKLGIRFADVAREKGLFVALNEIREATNGDNEAFGRILGSSEALTFALSVTGENAADAAAELAKIEDGADKGTVALEQYTEKSKSAVEQGKRLIANIQNFLVSVGGPFVSTLGPAIFAVNELGRAFGLQGIAAKALGGVFGGLAVKLVSGLKGLELGTRFETLVTKAMTKIGDPIIDGVSNAWGKVAGSSKVSGAIDGAGKFMGSKLGKGLSIAFAAVAVFEVIDTYNRIKEEASRQAADIGTNVANQIATGTVDQLKQSRGAVAQGLADLMSIPDFGIVTGDSRNKLMAELERLNTAIAEAERRAGQPSGIIGAAGADLGDRFGKQVIAGATPLAGNLTDLMKGVMSGATAGAAAAMRTAGGQLARNVANGIREKRASVGTAWQALLDAIHNGMKPAAERARLVGQLTSKELIWGLKSKDPAVRAQAAATKQVILDRLEELGGAAAGIGKSGMAALAKAMKSKDPDIRKAALRILRSASKVAPSQAQATTWGEAIGQGLINGMNAKAASVGAAAGRLASAIASYLATHSPAEKGPLSLGGGPEGMGESIGRLFTRGLEKTMPDLSRIGAFAMPQMAFAAGVVPAAGASAAVGRDLAGHGGPQTVVNHYHLTAKVEAARKARDPLEVAKQMGRAARSATFSHIKTAVDDDE